MKEVSIQTLKAGLSGAVAEAEAGATIVITRHHQPVARLGPAHAPQVHMSRSSGRGRLKPALKRGSRGRYLAVLREDRSNR